VVVVEALHQGRRHDRELVLRDRERRDQRVPFVKTRARDVHRGPVRAREDRSGGALRTAQRPVQDHLVEARLGQPFRQEIQPGAQRARGHSEIEVGEVVARLAGEGARQGVDLVLHRAGLAPGRPFHDALGGADRQPAILGRLLAGAGAHPGLDGDHGPRVDLAHHHRDLVRENPDQIGKRLGMLCGEKEKQCQHGQGGAETHSVLDLLDGKIQV